MKNTIKRVGIIFVVFMTLMLVGCSSGENTELANLRNDVSRLTSENDELRNQLTSSSEEEVSSTLETEEVSSEPEAITESESNSDMVEEDIISIFFWSDGCTYKPSEETFQLYWDCFCSNKVGDSTLIISPQIMEVKLENGNTAFAMLSDKGIVWSVKRPYLQKIE